VGLDNPTHLAVLFIILLLAGGLDSFAPVAALIGATRDGAGRVCRALQRSGPDPARAPRRTLNPPRQ
jgi:hypothetical protein